MPKRPTESSELASHLPVAEEIMREDEAVLRGLAGRETDVENQVDVARKVMVRRRRALAKLAR